MTVQVRTRAGGNVEVTEVPQRDEKTPLADLAKERARLQFKLSQSGHNPASVVDRVAELDALIAERSG